MSEKHTPTPWRVYRYANGKNVRVEGIGEDPNLLGIEIVRVVNVADGEYIVECVNNHEALQAEVTQLKKLLADMANELEVNTCIGKDKTGRNIHIGDVLDFDGDEWGSNKDHRFTVEFINGEICFDGSYGDLDQFCTKRANGEIYYLIRKAKAIGGNND